MTVLEGYSDEIAEYRRVKASLEEDLREVDEYIAALIVARAKLMKEGN